MHRAILSLVLCLMTGLFCSPTAAQDEVVAAAKAFKIKQVKLQGFTGQFVEPLAWLVIDKKNSILIADDYDEAHDKDAVRSFILSSKGKAGASNLIFDAGGGKIRDGAGFWFRGGPLSSGNALIVLAQNPKGAYPVRIIAAVLDDSGKIWVDFETIAVFTPPTDSYFNEIWVVGARKDGIVGIVIGLGIFENSDGYYGRRACKAYFMKINADGSLHLDTPAPIQINLPNGGDYRAIRPYQPIWTGERWLLPAVMTNIVPETYEGKDHEKVAGYQLYVLAITPNGAGDSFQFKSNSISKTKGTQYWSPFDTPVLLAAIAGAPPAAGAEGNSIVLLYTKAKPNKQTGAGYHSKQFSYYLQALDDAGKRSGKKRKEVPPGWNRQYKLGPDLINESTYSFLSNPVVDSEGRFLIALSRAATIYRKSDSKLLSEIQLDFFTFDPASATGGIVATGNYNDRWISHAPLVRMFDSVARVLNQCYDEKPSGQEQNLYISKF